MEVPINSIWLPLRALRGNPAIGQQNFLDFHVAALLAITNWQASL
jgi:hypothetical protein